MEKIGIIINPHARKNRMMRGDAVRLYREIGGDYVDVRITRSPDEILTVAEDFRKGKVSYLGVSGGDGTLHHVISRFVQVYKTAPMPPLVLLKGGTMDTISRTIHLKGKGPAILQRLVTALKEGREIELHARGTVKIEDKYGFLFGLGLASNFLCEYYKGGNTGTLKAVKVAAVGIASTIAGKKVGALFERMNARVLVDGSEIGISNFLGILAGTVAEVGIGFAPLSRAYEKEGTFHVMLAGFNPMTLVKQIGRFRNGRPLKHQDYYDNIATNLRIIGPKKFQYQIDGDLYEATGELRVDAGPTIRLVYV